jgi:hypothetical protein
MSEDIRTHDPASKEKERNILSVRQWGPSAWPRRA